MTTSTLHHSPQASKAIELRLKVGGLMLALLMAAPLLTRLHG